MMTSGKSSHTILNRNALWEDVDCSSWSDVCFEALSCFFDHPSIDSGVWFNQEDATASIWKGCFNVSPRSSLLAHQEGPFSGCCWVTSLEWPHRIEWHSWRITRKVKYCFSKACQNVRPRFFHSVLSNSLRDYRSIDLDDIRRNEANVGLLFCWQCAGW